jgi:hypothetical protein
MKGRNQKKETKKKKKGTGKERVIVSAQVAVQEGKEPERNTKA